MFVSLLTQCIHETLSSVFSKAFEVNNEKEILSKRNVDPKLMKKAAMEQQTLMTRQAEARTKQERENNGLVILRAIYYVESGAVRFDVTTPLRFWVTDSSLVLAECPKNELLGFYDICADGDALEDKEKADADSWWHGFWTVREFKPTVRCNPRLFVEYQFAGIVYETTIDNDERLILPAPNGKIVARTLSWYPDNVFRISVFFFWTVLAFVVE